MHNFFLVITTVLIISLSIAPQAFASDLDDLYQQITNYRAQGKMDIAETLASKLLTEATAKNQAKSIADAYFQMARNAMERNQYDNAQIQLNKAISGYQQLNLQRSLGHALRQLGLTYRYQSQYDKALEFLYQSMQIFEQIGDKKGISGVYNSIGVVLERMGQYTEAIQAHQHSLDIKYELGDNSGIASGLYNLGDIRRQMGDYDTALKYFYDALALDETSGNLKDIAYSNHKIGYVLNTLKRHDEARIYLNKTLSLFKEIKTPRDTDWARTSLAKLALDTGALSEAETIILGVIERAIANQYQSLLADAYLIASNVYIQKQNYNKALTYISAGSERTKLNNEVAKEADFEALRVKVYMALNLPEQAISALQKQKSIEDSLFNKKRIDAIANAQAKTEFVRRATKIELLEKEKSLQQALLKQEKLNITIILLTVVGCLTVVFLIYGRRLQRKTNSMLGQLVKQRTAELEQKNNELQQAYAEIEAISLTDRLTGLNNRRFLENHIYIDLEQCRRIYQNWQQGNTPKPEQSDIVVFILDIDDFKMINDTFGHNAGDNILSQFAQRMAKVFRHSDYLIRWGGEEFVAIARGINREDGPLLAERMVEAINNQEFQLSQDLNQELSQELGQQQTHKVTCSIGFSCYPPIPAIDIECSCKTLIALADACLYQVKSSGKNSWLGIIEANVDAVFNDNISHEEFKQLVKNKEVTLTSPNVAN
ncbi:tetratricopeptide repeat-containing diguanylate cyclase [Colwellia sp. MEBiC06753]